MATHPHYQPAPGDSNPYYPDQQQQQQPPQQAPQHAPHQQPHQEQRRPQDQARPPVQYEQPISLNGPQRSELKCIISGRPMFAQADIYLDEGEKALCDGGAIAWMDGGMGIETHLAGGLFKGCGRCCAGDSCCMNTVEGPGRVGVNMPLPGDIMSFAVTKDFGWLLSQGAFIAGTNNLNISARFSGCGAACCSDEGVFMGKVTSKDGQPGMFLAGGFGGIKRIDVPAGETLFVDNGLFFAAEAHTKITMRMVGGLKSTCCSGEGLVMAFQGPATIFCQSRDPSLFRPFDPTKPDAGNKAQ